MDNFEKYLPEIITSLKSTFGTDFFNRLTFQLSNIISADYTFIAKIDKKAYVSQTISVAAHGKILANFSYSLVDTPCADVADDSVCIYPIGICSLFPNDALLKKMNIEGYIGTPLHDSNGKVNGIVVALYEKKIKHPTLISSLFELFSGRISAEIEREDKEQQLLTFNKNLELIIQERTKELTHAIDTLKYTQEKLIEKEKMASLGALVAGVAHEINTPLGIAVLSSSNIHETCQKVSHLLESNQLKKSDLSQAISTLIESEQSLSYNLQRAAELVLNFKEVAVDRNTDVPKTIAFDTWLEALLTSLKPMLKKTYIQLQLLKPAKTSPNFVTYPSKLSQVIANLISNTAIHAFDKNDKTAHTISIDYQIIDSVLTLTVSDNGKGIPAQNMNKIFDPFFTTNRSQGSSGLGLSIVHNIVKSVLGGDIKVASMLGQGATFTLTIVEHTKEMRDR